MTNQTFAEAVLGTRSQLEQFRQRHQQRSEEGEDESPAVAKRSSMFPAHSKGQLTALEAILERNKDKLAVDAMWKRDRAKLAAVKEQLADRQRPVPSTPEEFARRLKYGR
jgi:C4-type Zn-finger protein